LRIMDRSESSMDSTRTCVTPPREPVLPRTLTTLTSLTGVAFVVSCQAREVGRGQSAPTTHRQGGIIELSSLQGIVVVS